MHSCVSIPQWCDCCEKEAIKMWLIKTSFNPTMVRLLHQVHKSAVMEHQVSIPQWCDCCFYDALEDDVYDQFQSHNGAIAALNLSSQPSHRCCVSIPQWCDCCACDAGRNREGYRCFNPTMVRLLPSLPTGASTKTNSFNPTMVRLLPATWRCSCLRNRQFQSHNGAIAAQRRDVGGLQFRWFQSHNGAIAAGNELSGHSA